MTTLEYLEAQYNELFEMKIEEFKNKKMTDKEFLELNNKIDDVTKKIWREKELLTNNGVAN